MHWRLKVNIFLNSKKHPQSRDMIMLFKETENYSFAMKWPQMWCCSMRIKEKYMHYCKQLWLNQFISWQEVVWRDYNNEIKREKQQILSLEKLSPNKCLAFLLHKWVKLLIDIFGNSFSLCICLTNHFRTFWVHFFMSFIEVWFLSCILLLFPP